MAEGGFDNEDPWLDNKLDHVVMMMMTKKKLTERDHFNQACFHTPYHNGEHIEMHTLPRE